MLTRLGKLTDMGLYQIMAAKKAKRKATNRAEAAVVSAYGRLQSSLELDAVLDEKFGPAGEYRAEIRAYVQKLIPHLRDH